MNVKIKVFSDLHLEHHNTLDLDIPNDTEIVILAGDILVGSDTSFITDLCTQHPNKDFIWVAGNHEFYRGDVTVLNKLYSSLATSTDNLHYLNNTTVDLRGIRFHGTTLWTGFTAKGYVWKSVGMVEALRNIADFHCIKVRNSLMTPTIMEGLHKTAKNWLKKSLTGSEDCINVVITHFSPILECRHPAFPPSIMDCYFLNDLSGIAGEYNIHTWVSGHNHWSDSFTLYNTNFISNQLGYPREFTDFEVAGEFTIPVDLPVKV